MSLSHLSQNQQGSTGQGDGDEIEVNEEFKDEPPDRSQSHYFDQNAFDFDAFATSSLQAAASAILAVQEQRLPSDLSTSLPKDKTESPPRLQQQQGTDGSLSRSSSNGKATQPGGAGLHSERHMWSQKETKALVDGCNKHGIGNWKAILSDRDIAPGFNGRTPGDLKDRFRTYFPDAYHELYPNAKTHTSRAVRSKAPDGKSIFEKGKTKERRPFTTAEDEVLRKGYEQFGSHWAIIAKDSVFEGRRKSTDLRDRFRNAFPSLYEQAGYKPRTKAPKKERRQSSSGSFSLHDRAAVLPGEWRGESDSSQRPNLQARSETSTSVHSQAVSEHSEHSGDEDSDVLERGHGKDRSDSSHVGSVDAARPQSMDRTSSHCSSRSDRAHSPLADRAKSPPVPASGTQKPASSALRRSHSTKRANCSKLGSLDQAVKTAFTKSSKEAVLASHQHHHAQLLHQQHQQQQQQQQQQQMRQREYPEDASSRLQRPPIQHSMSAGWAPSRLAWLSGSASNGANLASMDLDQMGEIMNSHSATELLGEDDAVVAMPSGQSEEEAMNIDGEANVETNPTDFANLYQHLALATNGSLAANRALSIESFQDLLDPVLPLSSNGVSGWTDQTSAATSLPWTPVSSATAALNSSVPAHASTSATRREHEHNQWAGDLLHRGSFNEQEHGFVSMASMHLSGTGSPLPQSRSADDNLGQQRSSMSGQPLMEPRSSAPSHPYSTPSVHELISRSARRQSYPPRPLGLGDDGNGDDVMHAAYSNPYPYPADDISILNSSAGGSLTLFPSLVNSQAGNEYGQGGMMRRRRSTDTLREGVSTFPQPWKGGAMESARMAVEEEGKESDRQSASVSSRHATSQHSCSLSDAPTNDDNGDDDAPSRAASVGNLDLVSNRDNTLYAESLPDLSSGMGAHASSAASDSVFSHHHPLQISYDDMDLPSFFNRSPSVAAASALMLPRQGSEAAAGMRGTRSVDVRREGNGEGVGSTEMAKGPSKGMDRSSFAPGPTQHPAMGELFSFGSNPMTDAGALDRLEHLYLEGLHTPSSPMPMGGATIGSYGGGQGSSGANGMGRLGALNAGNPWWSTANERGGAGGADTSGYESV